MVHLFVIVYVIADIFKALNNFLRSVN